jgi:hypothetical protein
LRSRSIEERSRNGIKEAPKLGTMGTATVEVQALNKPTNTRTVFGVQYSAYGNGNGSFFGWSSDTVGSGQNQMSSRVRSGFQVILYGKRCNGGAGFYGIEA